MMRALLFHTVSHALRAGRSGGLGGFGLALYQKSMSLLFRLALGGMTAAIGGIVIGALATGGGFLQLIVTGFAAMALWLPAFLLVSALARWRQRLRLRHAVSRPNDQPTTAIRPRSENDIDASWGRLAAVAGHRRGAVRQLELKLAEVWRALPAQSLDPQVHELQVLIGRRVPELIDTRLSCLPLRSRERDEAVGELMALLDDFTSDSISRYDRVMSSGRHEHEVVRRRIEDHLDRKGFSPLS